MGEEKAKSITQMGKLCGCLKEGTVETMVSTVHSTWG
jgi:hypothetical protein